MRKVALPVFNGQATIKDLKRAILLLQDRNPRADDIINAHITQMENGRLST